MVRDVIQYRRGWWYLRASSPTVKARLKAARSWVTDVAGLRCGISNVTCTQDRMLVRRFLDICNPTARLAALESP